MEYRLTASTPLSKNRNPRSTRAELLRVDEETGKPYKDYAHHIDPERTAWNRVLVNRNVRDVYAEHIGPAIDAYNARQIASGHPERCKTVDGYMQQLLDGERAKNARKRPRLWNDLIIQCGDMITNEAYVVTQDGEKVMPVLARITNEVYKEFVEEFQKTFTNLVVTCACTHNDESTPHCMIQYLALCHNNKRGLPVQVKLIEALAESLDALGIPYNRKREDGVKHAFNKVLDDMLTDIMARHGIERVPGEPKEDKEIEDVPVAELRKRNRIIREQIKKMIDNGENPLDAIKAKKIPLAGTYYTEKDVRGLVNELLKQQAVLRAQLRTEAEIDKRNDRILHEQSKRQQAEMGRQRERIKAQQRESDRVLKEVMALKGKLEDKDEQRRYKMLKATVLKKEKELDQKLVSANALLSEAKADAKRVKGEAYQEARRVKAEVQKEVDALHGAYSKSPAGQRQREKIKMDLLAERYPDIDSRLDAEAGNIMLRGFKRHVDAGKGNENAR